ncbi:MAG: hypothetical protein Q9M25_05505 [Mariprofundaceae bacterium]|nr:hypothetical protein [Mariprofundaceae bacterium]
MFISQKKLGFFIVCLCVFSVNVLASVNTFAGFQRHEPNALPRQWIPAIKPVTAANPVVYFHDDGLKFSISMVGMRAGETWSAEVLPPNPDGTPGSLISLASSLTSWDGKCFTHPGRTPVCFTLPSGNGSIDWWFSPQCHPTGTWTIRLKNNGVVFKTAYVDLLPKVNEVAALQRFYEYQANYPNAKYDSICLPKIGQKAVKCGTTKATNIPYTISKKGCSISSLAMLKRYHTNNPASSSAIIVNNALLGKVKGFRLNGDVNWTTVSDGILKYPGWNVEKATWSSANDARLKRALCEYGPTIVPVKNFQHFVVVTGFDKVKGWEILDPGHFNNHSLNMYGGVYNGIRLIKGPTTKPLPIIPSSDYISITIHSPAELLLLDPLGSKVGFDPATGQVVKTIPGSTYWTHGQYNPDPAYIDTDPAKTIMFNNAVAGIYQLKVIGTGAGIYDLEFEMADTKGNMILSKDILNVPVTPGAVHTYTFNYNSAPGSVIQMQGGPPVPGVNHPPLANAGTNQAVECAAGFANVILNGAGSSDPDGDPLTYRWSGPFGVATGAKPTVNLPLGTHAITLTVNDGKGGLATATTQAIVQDTTPPVVNAGPNVTLPAAGLRGAPFSLQPAVSDACCVTNVVISPRMAVYPVGVTAITATATDCAGNTASSTMQLTVQAVSAPPVPPTPGNGGGQSGIGPNPPSPSPPEIVGDGEDDEDDEDANDHDADKHEHDAHQ